MMRSIVNGVYTFDHGTHIPSDNELDLNLLHAVFLMETFGVDETVTRSIESITGNNQTWSLSRHYICCGGTIVRCYHAQDIDLAAC